MNFKRWKLGMLVAAGTGFFTGLIALSAGASWKVALLVIGGCIGKDFLLWAKDHPVDQITFDDAQSKPTADPKKP